NFTGKGHNFLPGEAVEKQLIIVNNSRETAACECEWSLGLSRPVAGSKKVTVRTGDQERIPLRFELPAALAAGIYELTATVRFGDREPQKDTFPVSVLPRPADPAAGLNVALFDPKGETARLLTGLGVRFRKVEAGADLSGDDVLIVGKGALAPDGPGAGVGRGRGGLEGVMFEL